MLTLTWLGSAFLLGLAGGFHCMAMCGNFCARGFSQHHSRFQLGRAIAYIVAGIIGGGAYWIAAKATVTVSGLKPLLQLLLGLVLVHGVYMAITGRSFKVADLRPTVGTTGLYEQPVFFKASLNTRLGAMAAGASLPLLPCGLFYAALANAALSGSAIGGGTTMAMFVLGSSPWLALGNRLFSPNRRIGAEKISMKVAGLFSAIGAGIALWAGFFDLQICNYIVG